MSRRRSQRRLESSAMKRATMCKYAYASWVEWGGSSTLVQAGANQVDGPSFTLDKPQGRARRSPGGGGARGPLSRRALRQRGGVAHFPHPVDQRGRGDVIHGTSASRAGSPLDSHLTARDRSGASVTATKTTGPGLVLSENAFQRAISSCLICISVTCGNDPWRRT